MTQPDDYALLEAWRDGAADAGEALFERHFDAISRFFRNKSSDGVDDLIQKTFLGAVEAKQRFEGASTFRTFLFAIAHNVLGKHYRTKARDKTDFDDTSVQDMAPGQSTIVARKREHRLLVEALRRIPMESQVILELQYWEQMSTAEIGEVLQIPQGTAKTKLRRAKQLLSEQMDRLAGDPGLAQSTMNGVESWAADLRAAMGGLDARPG